MKKGAFGGLCNRSACLRPGADWYNHSTRAYYCGECAGLINWPGGRADAIRLFGHLCCTQGEHKEPKIELRADRVGFTSPEYARRIAQVQADVESLKSHNPNRRD